MQAGVQASQNQITIDDVCLADIPQIIEIDSEITKIAKPELWYSYYAPAGRSQPRWFLVAHEDTRVVGYILGEVRAWEFGSPPCGWIFAIGVSPDQRIGGIGTRLLDAMIERFRPTGVKTIRTMLHIDENVLMSFFRSQGLAAGPFIQLEASIDL
jgi:GNAT superfamily N-acetyltransferase